MCSGGDDAYLGLQEAYSLADRINELAAHISAATCRWLSLISEFDRGEGHIHYGFPSCADWLAWSCSLSHGTAREHVRVARALDDPPLIRASFASGKLSFSKARALTRIATADNEEYLLMLSEHETAAQLERTVRYYRRTTAVSLDEANAARERRFLSCGWDDDGFFNIRGRLSAEEGALVMQALDVAEQRRGRRRVPQMGSGTFPRKRRNPRPHRLTRLACWQKRSSRAARRRNHLARERKSSSMSMPTRWSRTEALMARATSRARPASTPKRRDA